MHLSYGVCRLRARVQLKTLSSVLNEDKVNGYANRGFARQPCCMARKMVRFFSCGKKCPFLCKPFSLLLPCNLAVMQNLHLDWSVFKVSQNSFQHFPRHRFWCVIITTLYHLMLQSKNWPIIGKHNLVLFWIRDIIGYHSNTLNFSFKHLYFKSGRLNFFLIIEFW